MKYNFEKSSAFIGMLGMGIINGATEFDDETVDIFIDSFKVVYESEDSPKKDEVMLTLPIFEKAFPGITQTIKGDSNGN